MDFTGERLIPGKIDQELEIEHFIRYKFAKEIVRDKIVLDAACGVGYGSAILAENAREVYGLDISSEAIEFANKNYKSSNVKFIENSVEKLPFEDNLFDVVVSFETIEHVGREDQVKFLSEIKRVLKDDGMLIISTPNHDIYMKRGNNEFHKHELSCGEFRDLLNSHFKNVELFSQQFEVCDVIVGQSNKFACIDGGLDLEQSEYLLAVCSNKEIKDLKARIFVRDDSKFFKILDWAISNDNLNNEKEIKIKELTLANEKLINENLDKTNKYYQELDKCKEVEDELIRVYNSRGYKMLEKMYKLEGIVVPPGSRRRFLAKMVFKFLRHPIVCFKKVTPKNIKNFLNVLVSGNTYAFNEGLEFIDDKECKFVYENVYEGREKYDKLVLDEVTEPLVSIIIPVYNQFHYTYNCIKAIKRFTNNVPYEIIIADDVSTDKTTEIENIIENVRVSRNKENLGFLLNCNKAAKLARGKYIVFLNNDTSVQENWLSSLLEVIEKDETIGMVGSKLVYPTGHLQEAGGIFWNDASAWNYGRGKHPGLPEYNYLKDVDYISGASIMIRKWLWEDIGGFDDRYAPAYYEDSDLAFEVRAHGYRVVYQPKSVVVHFEGMSNGTDTSTGVKAYQVQNKDKFYEKWKAVLQKDHFKNGDNVFLARDRSKNKKCILFVDHYVPTFDKDAGSRAAYQHLKILCDMGYNVKFIGDNFFKYKKYTDVLEQMGIEVLYGQKYMNTWKEWVKENAKYIDTVILSRPHISVKYIDIIKKYTKAKVIYYVHDLVFVREQREYEIKKDLAILNSAKKFKDIELNLMNKSDVVVTFSTYEKEIIDKEIGEGKAVVLPIFIFDKFNFEKVDFNEKKDIIFVGGFKHKPNEDAVLWFVKDIWPKILKEVPECNFIIAGSNPTEKIKELECDNIKVTGFISDEELASYYKTCKVCVIPLRFGAGVKGKTIEAIYNKIPVVSTSVGIEGINGIEDCIRATDTAKDFANKVVEYYNNPKLSEETVDNYHSYLSKYFSSNYAKGLFSDIL